MADLDLDIHLQGRTPKPVYAEALRELRESDLALLTVERGTKPSHVARISSRHHALARLLALGSAPIHEICLVTGYTASRVSVLKGDPAFQELIAHYTACKGEAVVDLQDRMVTLATDAVEVLQDRLETDPDGFAVEDLHDIVKLTADRSGFGPKQTNVNVNVNLGDRLRAARERVSASALPAASSDRGQGSFGGNPASTVIDGQFEVIK